MSYIGYDLGSTQMYHNIGLAVDDVDIGKAVGRVDKFVALAPCPFGGPPLINKNQGRKEALEWIHTISDENILYAYGDGSESETNYTVTCLGIDDDKEC